MGLPSLENNSSKIDELSLESCTSASSTQDVAELFVFVTLGLAVVGDGALVGGVLAGAGVAGAAQAAGAGVAQGVEVGVAGVVCGVSSKILPISGDGGFAGVVEGVGVGVEVIDASNTIY